MTDLILAGSPFDSIRRVREDGSEYWDARELQPLLGYVRWEDFRNAIERARYAIGNAGLDPREHASARSEAFGPTRQVGANYHLTRYGAYMAAMNGDPRKKEIADAQTYFAVKTREAETHSVAQSTMLDLSDPLGELQRASRQLQQAVDIAIAERERAEIAESKLTEQAPAVEAWNYLINADGDYSVRDAAQLLCRAGIDTGQRRLFAKLRELKWIDQGGTPYQSHVDCGRIVSRATSYEHPRTGDRVATSQVRLTAKGVEWLLNHLPRKGLTLVRGGEAS